MRTDHLFIGNVHRPRVFFASFPRSGSIWYLTMLGESIGVTKHEMVYKRTIKIHERLQIKVADFSSGEKIFYLYRHPKDALLSFARYIHRKKEIRKWKEIGKSGKITGEMIWNKFDTNVLEELLFKTSSYQPLLSASWWVIMMTHYMKLKKYIDKYKDINFCLLKYEDILLSPEKEVERGLKFLGYSDIPKLEKYLTSSSPEERLRTHTNKYKHDSFWTNSIDKRINEELGNSLREYGYEV